MKDRHYLFDANKCIHFFFFPLLCSAELALLAVALALFFPFESAFESYYVYAAHFSTNQTDDSLSLISVRPNCQLRVRALTITSKANYNSSQRSR